MVRLLLFFFLFFPKKTNKQTNNQPAGCTNIAELVMAELQGTVVHKRFCSDLETVVRNAIEQSGCVDPTTKIFQRNRALAFVQRVRSLLLQRKQEKKQEQEQTQQTQQSQTQCAPAATKQRLPKASTLWWVLRRVGVRVVDDGAARCAFSLHFCFLFFQNKNLIKSPQTKTTTRTTSSVATTTTHTPPT